MFFLTVLRSILVRYALPLSRVFGFLLALQFSVLLIACSRRADHVFHFANPASAQLLGHTEPAVIKALGTYYLYYRTDSDEIAVASSSDGENWTDQGVVLSQTARGSDLVSNPGAENGSASPDDWNRSPDTVWSAARAHTGSHSLEINVANSSADWRADHFSVSASQAYYLSGWIYGTATANEWFLTVRWFSDSDGTQFAQEDNIAIPTGSYDSWTQISDYLTSPSNAAAADMVFRSIDGSGDLFVDDVDLQTNPWDSAYVISPSVVYHEDLFYLFYEGNNGDHSEIGYATSADPLGTFTKSESNPVLAPQGSGFESVTVGTPFIMRDNEKWYLYYHGYDGTSDRGGLAWSSDLASWTRHSSNPILWPGASGAWDDHQVSPHSVLLVNRAHYIFYEGTRSDLHWAIGVASIASADVETSTPAKLAENPVLSRNPSGWDDDWVQLPGIFNPQNGDLWLYYCGHNASENAFHLGRAVDSSGTLAGRSM
jgi:predicted GH43/DUF377 family glycosyl hydrolase